MISEGLLRHSMIYYKIQSLKMSDSIFQDFAQNNTMTLSL